VLTFGKLGDKMPFMPCDDNFLFVEMGELCKTAVHSCSIDSPLVEMVAVMHSQNITGMVVMDAGKPVGVCSFRDVLRLVAERSGHLSTLTVRDGMHRGLISIQEHDFVFDAIFTMARHNIHRIVVLKADGSVAGLVTVTDLLNLQTKTPMFINGEIETAGSIDELKLISRKMLSTVVLASKAGADIKILVKLISHFNDAQTRRLIFILEQEEAVFLPVGFSYLVLGSEGREEQTLRTDQDSAIAYRNGASPQSIEMAERFAARMVEALEEVGVPRCPSDGMASNPKWRHSLSEWQELLELWITNPTPENMVDFGMFQDLRTMYGDETLEQQIHEYILSLVKKNSLFFVYSARNLVRFSAPLGMFNRFKVEPSGEGKGKVDIKKGGIFAITAGATLLALEAGIVGGTTWEKLEKLGERGIISSSDCEIVLDAFTCLVTFRLQRQLKALERGEKPSNFVDPMILSEKEQAALRKAFKAVNLFLRIIKDHFQLDFMAR